MIQKSPLHNDSDLFTKDMQKLFNEMGMEILNMEI